MAYTGLKYCVFAPITTEEPFSPIVYGKGVVLGKMISANITMTRNSDPLYADDAIAESDNSITGGTISLNLDDIDDAARVSAFGVLKEGEPGSETYSETGDPTPYGGLGYIRVRKRKGVTSYVAYWVHKCQIAINTDSANTKGSTITWQTPTVDGTIMAAYPNADKKARFRDDASFATQADAYSWINEKAGIA